MTYDLKDVSLPKLGTAGLRAVVALAESPIIGPLLVERLKRDGGLAGFAQRTPDEVPTMYPHLPADARAIPPLVQAATPTTAPGFRFPGVDDYHDAYRAGRTTPTDVATQFLARARYLLLGVGAALENVVPAVPADTFVALGGLVTLLGVYLVNRGLQKNIQKSMDPEEEIQSASM